MSEKKKKPTWLRKPMWKSVDLVDNPADEHARIAIWKRDTTTVANDSTTTNTFHLDFSGREEEEIEKRTFSAEQRRTLAKKGHALPDGSFPIVNRDDLSNAIQAFGRAKDKEKAKRHIIKRARALGATEMLPDSWSIKKKEGAMPDTLDEDVRKSLDEDVQAYITDLETKLEGAAGQNPSSTDTNDDPSPITKRDDLPEDVREYIAKQDSALEKVSKALETTNETLASEVEKREIREWTDRFDELDTLQFEDRDDVIKNFRELAKQSPDLAEKQFSALKKANEQASEGSLFAELGSEGSPPAAGSAEAEMEKVVKSVQEDQEVDETEAWAIVTDTRPDLYKRYLDEQKTGV